MKHADITSTLQTAQHLTAHFAHLSRAVRELPDHPATEELLDSIDDLHEAALLLPNALNEALAKFFLAGGKAR